MKIKVKVPGELNDIKLSQYQKFIRTTEGKEDENWLTRQYVAVFCNLPDKVIGQVKKSDFNDMLNHIQRILSQDGKFERIIKYNGKEYGFIPKLDDITVDEQADLEHFLKDVQTLDKAMGVCYRPIKSKVKDSYLIEEYKGEGESLDLPLGIVTGATAFFLNLLNDCLNCIPNYIQDHQTLIQPILEENGIGTITFMHSLRETLDGLKKSVSYDYMSA